MYVYVCVCVCVCVCMCVYVWSIPTPWMQSCWRVVYPPPLLSNSCPYTAKLNWSLLPPHCPLTIGVSYPTLSDPWSILPQSLSHSPIFVNFVSKTVKVTQVDPVLLGQFNPIHPPHLSIQNIDGYFCHVCLYLSCQGFSSTDLCSKQKFVIFVSSTSPIRWSYQSLSQHFRHVFLLLLNIGNVATTILIYTSWHY